MRDGPDGGTGLLPPRRLGGRLLPPGCVGHGWSGPDRRRPTERVAARSIRMCLMTTDHGRSSPRWTRWAVSAPMSRAQATAAGPAWGQPSRMVAPAVVTPAATARRSVANAHCSRAVPCCRNSPSAVLTIKAARRIAGASSEASAAISWTPRQVGPSSRHPPGRRPLLPAERERRPATQEREHPGEWRAESWACGHGGIPPGSGDGHKAPARRPDFPAHPTSLDVYFALYLLPALPNSPARNGVGRGPAYPLTPGLVRLAIMRDARRRSGDRGKSRYPRRLPPAQTLLRP